MKSIYWLSMFIILMPGLFSCVGDSAKEKEGTSGVTMSFEETVYDFGTIPFDSDGRCSFEFLNDSDQPLVINTVRTSCGCTRPEWPEEPVNPGDKARIGITYNTKIPGTFHKSITVYSNANNSPAKLFIKGNVEAGKEGKL